MYAAGQGHATVTDQLQYSSLLGAVTSIFRPTIGKAKQLLAARCNVDIQEDNDDAAAAAGLHANNGLTEPSSVLSIHSQRRIMPCSEAKEL